MLENWKLTRRLKGGEEKHARKGERQSAGR